MIVQESIELLHEMKLAGLEPDKQCYLSAIATCLRVGEWQAPTDLVRSLSSYVSKEDSARPQVGQDAVAHHAIQLKSAMDAAGLKPTQVSPTGGYTGTCRRCEPGMAQGVEEDSMYVVQDALVEWS